MKTPTTTKDCNCAKKHWGSCADYQHYASKVCPVCDTGTLDNGVCNHCNPTDDSALKFSILAAFEGL